MPTNKSLGQHWLHDRSVLASIAEAADIASDDTVLEIGPGLGTLTSELLRRSKKVIAVEFDQDLAAKLPKQFPGTSLEVIRSDILSFDLTSLPAGYKVVANIPYYITSKIVQLLMTAENKPSIAVLLTQKEVAERLAAVPGDLSLLAISAQVYAEVSLGPVVLAELFTPAPKVDSQVIILKLRAKSLVTASDEKRFFQVVKAGFSAKRKKIRSSLAGGMAVSKEQAEKWLADATISSDIRAQDLSISDWQRLVEVIHDNA